MSSPTKATEARRKNKNRKQGRDRKKALAKNGSTKSEKQLFGTELSKGDR